MSIELYLSDRVRIVSYCGPKREDGKDRTQIQLHVNTNSLESQYVNLDVEEALKIADAIYEAYLYLKTDE